MVAITKVGSILKEVLYIVIHSINRSRKPKVDNAEVVISHEYKDDKLEVIIKYDDPNKTIR